MRRDKFKTKLMEKRLKEGCQSLREFLKCKHYHLTSFKIPFDQLQKQSASITERKNREDESNIPKSLLSVKKQLCFLSQGLGF